MAPAGRLIGGDRLMQQLRRLHQESPKTIRSGLARLAFEVRDVVQDEVARSLHWSGPQTEAFIARGFKVKYGSGADGVFRAEIYPLARSAALLARHVSAFTNVPGQRADIELGGRLAIPVPATVQRGRRGKVPGRMAPRELLERDAKGRSRGFVNRAGTALMLRTGPDSVVPAYALRSQTSQQRRIDLAAVTSAAVRMRAGAAFADAIGRARRAAGIR